MTQKKKIQLKKRAIVLNVIDQKILNKDVLDNSFVKNV